MAQTIEAVYSNGMLRLLGTLPLADQQRVRVTVELVEPMASQRNAALARFQAGVARMGLFVQGPLPSRDDLHDRV